MKKIAQFMKVSFEQYQKDLKIETINDQVFDIKKSYDNIILPTRATKHSAGYDFKMPYDVVVLPRKELLIASGIKVQMESNWVLQLYPRSSLGFKYYMALANTVAIIDSDYFYSNNEGHIMIKIINHSDDALVLKSGINFVQGLFLEYGITVDDEVETLRNGGIGSTDIQR